MKHIKWKSLILTCMVCLMPIILGLVWWDKLPDTMAVHFNLNNEPDNFASKEFVVFLLPFIMAVVQCFCCVVTDLDSRKHNNSADFVKITKWIIPVITTVLQVITLAYGMGKNIDIRRVSALMLSVLFIVIGIYIPKLDYIRNMKIDEVKARKINRFAGIVMVIIGIAFLISSFLPAVATVVCVGLLILYSLIFTVYGIIVAKKK